MPPEKRAGFVNVDELMPQVTLGQVAAFYGVELPELKTIGAETRARCFLACGRTGETGDRALAIQTDHPAKQFKCHQYQCGKSGNLISLMDLMKPGGNGTGRPRGDRFKQIAADLRAIVSGESPASEPRPTAPSAAPQPAPQAKVNIPLARSPNERARALVDLDRKFITDPAAMPPAASAYFRRRPFLLSEECRTKWRAGYLPRDAGGEDKSGGTMRGSVVYCFQSEENEVLTWFGRDPDYERKHQLWLAGDKSDREPEKFHFVKGFHRGQELYGAHRLRDPEVSERLKSLNHLIVTEGPNDAIALGAQGVPAVALCSNTITDEQVDKLAKLVADHDIRAVALMLDNDEPGELGVRQALPLLAARVPVRLAWSSGMFGGRFKGRQPETLLSDEWGILIANLRHDGGKSGEGNHNTVSTA